MATKINAAGLHYKDLNHLISSSADKDIVVDNVLGQRYIGRSSADKRRAGQRFGCLP